MLTLIPASVKRLRILYDVRGLIALISCDTEGEL